MSEEAKSSLCKRLYELEKFVEEKKDEIPASVMGLMHIRRAMELMGCKIEAPAFGEKELELRKKGIIVE
jgi:hypothetical protein